jgi:hypothetical protein
MFGLLTLCVLVALVGSGAATPARPIRVRPYNTQYHSLSQACYGVLEDKCPPAAADRADCLMLNFADNDSHDCKLWVGWRTLCNVYVTMKLVPNGQCNFTEKDSTPELVRGCLLAADKSLLPPACWENPYYKSLTLHGRRRMDDDGDL